MAKHMNMVGARASFNSSPAISTSPARPHATRKAYSLRAAALRLRQEDVSQNVV